MIAEKVDKPRDIEFKGATDLVTDTDKASEEAVLSVSSCFVCCESSLWPAYDTPHISRVLCHSPRTLGSCCKMRSLLDAAGWLKVPMRCRC